MLDIQQQQVSLNRDLNIFVVGKIPRLNIKIANIIKNHIIIREGSITGEEINLVTIKLLTKPILRFIENNINTIILTDNISNNDIIKGMNRPVYETISMLFDSLYENSIFEDNILLDQLKWLNLYRYAVVPDIFSLNMLNAVRKFMKQDDLFNINRTNIFIHVRQYDQETFYDEVLFDHTITYINDHDLIENTINIIDKLLKTDKNQKHEQLLG